MNKPTLTEYPRMKLVRDSYISLNGIWEYAIRKDEALPLTFDGPINVPFSPETPLSGVEKMLLPGEYLFYSKEFSLPPVFVKDKVYLHFGAVDQIAKVLVNGKHVITHIGGFLPFSVEISRELIQGSNTLALIVQDFSDTHYHSRGKQKIKRGNIWYTPQSGIYMPVWLESVPAVHVRELRVTPHYDDHQVEISVFSDESAEGFISFADNDYPFVTNKAIFIHVANMISWSPTRPYLYPFSVSLGEDFVTSYFAMRKVQVKTASDGHKRIFLNNEVMFQSGLLDQGYYHEGYLTPPNEEAIINDIELAKKMGFNVLRKHIKIEWERFYYHCDRLGMLVWQDFVNGGARYSLFTIHVPAVLNITLNDTRLYKRFGRKDARSRSEFYDEVRATIKHLYHYPSIILWTVFNEGWGQFDSGKLLPFVQNLDSTRLIDLVSGWHDQGHGEFRSKHVYFRRYRHKGDKYGRAVILSEFGGYSQPIPGHTFSKKDFGYRKYADGRSLEVAFIRLYEKEIIPAVAQGLAAAIYTQLSDVEDEVNGIITYDRKIVKLDPDVVKALNKKLWMDNQ